MRIATRIPWKRLFGVTVLAALAFQAGRLWAGADQEQFYLDRQSPDGRYTAIATYPAWELGVMRFPGQSGDKSGFVTIYGRDGTNYGKIPVPMVHMIHDIDWSAQGARLTGIGAWDFKDWTYWYWDRDQTERHHGRAR